MNKRPSLCPVLVFKAYEGSAANSGQVAKLELRNATKRAIWLSYSGSEFPLSPPFIERLAAVPPKATNATKTNVPSIRLGSFFMHAEKLLPGNSMLFDFPLHSGEPTKQVGIWYYLGTFVDGSDFMDNLRTPVLNQRANWNDRGAFYWQKLKRSFRAPQKA